MARIDVQNHSLFSPEDIQRSRFSWALGLVNWVHVRTRADFIRDEIVLSEGACFDPVLLEESLRLLRELGFIARAEGSSYRLDDGSWVVEVSTWDEWTTQLDANVNLENTLQFKGISVAERNFLGRGLTLAARYRRFRERYDRRLALESNRLFGTRLNSAISTGVTRTGTYLGQSFSYPFLGEQGRLSFGSRVRYENQEYSYLTGEAGLSHVLLPFTDQVAGASVARRFGAPGELTLLGGEVEILHRMTSTPVRQVVRHDFESATTAPDSLAERLGGQLHPASYVRLGATVGLRRLQFTTRRGLDLVSGVQDVALGTEATLTLGRTLETWGSGPLDSYARFQGFAQGASGPWLGNVVLRAEGRRLDTHPAGTSPWRDLVLGGRGLVYFAPDALPGQVLVAEVSGDMRWNVDQPYQATLGGAEGVRGYADDEVPVAGSVVATLEQRINLPLFRPVVDLGLTVFGDLGRGWAGDVPFGIDTGWRTAVGGGLRLGFPAGTGSITRIEIAWPVGDVHAGRGPVVRTYWSVVRTSR